MTAVWLAALAAATTAMATVRVIVPPRRRLRDRVRPYVVRARRTAGRVAEPGAVSAAELGSTPSRGTARTVARMLLTRIARFLETRGDEHLSVVLTRAGMHDVTPEAFRVRRVIDAALVATLATVIVASAARSPMFVVLAGSAGFAFGATRTRRRVERATVVRSEQLRHELVTMNQLLAIHVRTGAGPMQAVQRVVARGRGAVVEELTSVLRWTRAGVREADAFRRAAELTAEPSAARTYLLFATAVERGADLGVALLALSHDLRDARRELVHQQAIRRRAAMLLPTIAILAPIMLLFIAAPLPSMVLNSR